jgi:hypothetical protein
MNDDSLPAPGSLSIPHNRGFALRGNSLVARGLQDIAQLEGPQAGLMAARELTPEAAGPKPDLVRAAIKMTVSHVKAGALSFADFANDLLKEYKSGRLSPVTPIQEIIDSRLVSRSAEPAAARAMPVVIQISHQEVMQRAPQRVVEIINSFIPDLLERNRNRVQLEVLGYGDDPRELYDIPEVRDYFRALHQIFPGMFYWLDTNPDGFAFILMGLMLYSPIRIGGGQVTISPQDLQDYLMNGYIELNAFCDHYGISADATNHSILEWLGGRKS